MKNPTMDRRGFMTLVAGGALCAIFGFSGCKKIPEIGDEIDFDNILQKVSNDVNGATLIGNSNCEPDEIDNKISLVEKTLRNIYEIENSGINSKKIIGKGQETQNEGDNYSKSIEEIKVTIDDFESNLIEEVANYDTGKQKVDLDNDYDNKLLAVQKYSILANKWLAKEGIKILEECMLNYLKIVTIPYYFSSNNKNSIIKYTDIQIKRKMSNDPANYIDKWSFKSNEGKYYEYDFTKEKTSDNVYAMYQDIIELQKFEEDNKKELENPDGKFNHNVYIKMVEILNKFKGFFVK